MKKALDKDKALGMIDRVEEPAEWCHRLVVVLEPDRNPHRMVDLQPLNQWCDRDWAYESPAGQAGKVLGAAWK